MILHPLSDLVIVKPIKAEKILASGIVLLPLNDEDESCLEGDVVDLGPKVLNLKKGDRVLYSSNHNMTFLMDENTRLTTMREDEVIAILN
jgi:co-chaperonin GroES (HSP10)